MPLMWHLKLKSRRFAHMLEDYPGLWMDWCLVGGHRADQWLATRFSIRMWHNFDICRRRHTSIHIHSAGVITISQITDLIPDICFNYVGSVSLRIGGHHTVEPYFYNFLCRLGHLTKVVLSIEPDYPPMEHIPAPNFPFTGIQESIACRLLDELDFTSMWFTYRSLSSMHYLTITRLSLRGFHDNRAIYFAPITNVLRFTPDLLDLRVHTDWTNDVDHEFWETSGLTWPARFVPWLETIDLEGDMAKMMPFVLSITQTLQATLQRVRVVFHCNHRDTITFEELPGLAPALRESSVMSFDVNDLVVRSWWDPEQVSKTCWDVRYALLGSFHRFPVRLPCPCPSPVQPSYVTSSPGYESALRDFYI